jgi:DNA-binding Lrp family transcriptional regulator
MLSDFDKAILNAAQGDFPLESRPFAVLAERLNTDEATLLERLTALKQGGYLRRLGAYFDSDALGYQGTLVALYVSPTSLPSVIEAVNRYDGVTHNYEREGEYNLWFTLQTASENRRQKVLGEIRELPGVERMLELRSAKKYKVRVQFRLE